MVTQPRITVGTYNQVLATYLVPGLVGGAGLVVWGAFQEKLMVRLITLLGGILPFWGALISGVAKGHSAWQESSDPPAEAISDGGSMVGMLFLGWLPAGLVCILAHGLVR
jgi:hypothetical protein